MGRLIRMDLFRMRKAKMFWISGAIILVVCAVMQILAKILTNVLYDYSKNAYEGSLNPEEIQALASAKMLKEEYDLPAAFSGVLRSMFGGVTPLLIMVLVCAVAFMFADLKHGYVKNISGQIPHRSYLSMSKYIVVNIQSVIFVVIGTVGTIIGVLISRGIDFDEFIPDAILEFLIKLLLLFALTAIVMFFTIGLHNNSLGIVAAVFFGLGALSTIAMPFQLILTNVANVDFELADYLPDSLFFSINIDKVRSLIVALVCLAVFVPLTIKFYNKRDVK